ncbi:MAG: toxin ParE1/3/4 [Saprospiraceae bacterium]|jgi:toxin ParE1/3/4
MSLEYELSELALRDLESIWNYSAEQWSVKQANIYYELIFDVINSICQNPEIGKSIREVKLDHSSKLAKLHMILYKIDKGKILVDRILNQRMDIEKMY